MKQIQKIFLLLALFTLGLSTTLLAKAPSWPKEIELDKHTLIIYQPQPQDLKGNVLSILAAISVESKDKKEPVFGAIFAQTQADIDKSKNRVKLHGFKVTKLQFANEKDKRIEKLKKILEEKLSNLAIDMEYQKLLSTLEVKEMQKKESLGISTEAPNIIVTQKPSVLITIDGEPRLKPIEKTAYLRVINTPYTIIMDSKTSKYYINADESTWYSSKDIKSGYKIDKNTPAQIKKYRPSTEKKSPSAKLKSGPAPELVIVTKPTELISCDGKPEYTPIAKTTLMYVSNTESDLFMEIKTQKYYILLAGRWYSSKKLDSGWKYIKSTDLPKDFTKIPSDSSSSNVLYAVSGTIESKDAVIDAVVPQTASVKRSASINVEYDGAPEYIKIDGTSLSYVKNTQTPVILVDTKYYACDNAVWYVASSAYTSWSVATSVPEEIYSIPASSPMYNITFVKIYKVTDDLVYVGYTAGYTNTYVYNTTIVYGTGYNYVPWYGTYYYPYPATWGFHMRWNPYYGWGIGMSYSTGPFTFYIGGGGWYGHGYWGPYPYYRYGNGYRRGYNNGYRRGYIDGRLSGNRPDNGLIGKHPRRDNNIYNTKENRDRIKQTKPISRGDNLKSKVSNTSKVARKNNVFADKKGNVHRKVNNSWQKRDKSGWNSSARDKVSSHKGLDRSFESRNRGNNFSHGSFSGSRGSFGGGGRSFSGGGRSFGGRR